MQQISKSKTLCRESSEKEITGFFITFKRQNWKISLFLAFYLNFFDSTHTGGKIRPISCLTKLFDPLAAIWAFHLSPVINYGSSKIFKISIFQQNFKFRPPKGKKVPKLGLQVVACGKYLNWREKWALESLFIVTWRWLMMFWMWDCYGVEKCKWNICLVENSAEYIQCTPITLNCSFLVQQRLSRTFFDKSRNYY